MQTSISYLKPAAINEFASVVDEIVAEKSAVGIVIDERARDFIAACVASCAASGETDRERIKANALDHAV